MRDTLDTVDQIILDLDKEKWPEIEKRIRAYGRSQYELGFLDGEASVVTVEVEDFIPGCV